jgi:hypothetical protein
MFTYGPSWIELAGFVVLFGIAVFLLLVLIRRGPS